MFVLKAVILGVLIGLSNCASFHKDRDFFSDNLINKDGFELLKYDVDSVGINMENLAVDVLKQILFGPKREDNSEESTTEETTTEETTNVLMQPTEETTTIKHNRRRRQANLPICQPKNIEEQKLEQKHIKDLKIEVKKLKELILILRDQRDILNFLNKNSNTNLFKNVSTETLIKGLELLNEKERTQFRDFDEHFENKNFATVNENSNDHITKPNHEELENIKLELRKAVKTLNETKTILAIEQVKEKTLETELEHQKHDISMLKLLVQRLFNSSTPITKITKVNEAKNDSILGAVITDNFYKPQVKQPVVNHTEKLMNTSRESTNLNDKMRANTNRLRNNARSNDLSDIAKLLNNLNRQEEKTDLSSSDIAKILEVIARPEKKTDSTDLFEIEQELAKRRRQEETIRQLETLQKLISFRDNAQSKSLGGTGDDINKELRNLQVAINRLRPKEDAINIDVKDEISQTDRFQSMLGNLLNNQGQSANVGPATPSFGGAGFPMINNRDTFGRPQGGYYGNQGPYSSYNGKYTPNYWYDNSYGTVPNYGYGNGNGYYPNVNSYGPSDGYQTNYGYQKPPAYGPSNNQYAGRPSYGYGDSYGNGNNYGVPKDQFFLSNQPNQYDKAAGPTGYPGETAYGSNQDRYGKVTQQAAASAADYRNVNVEDLKTQIYSLQNVINDLNRPEYIQKPEDKQTVYNLEKQISELKNVVNVLNTDNGYGSQAGNQKPVDQASANYDQNPPQPYEAKTRRRRSVENNKVDDDFLVDKTATFFERILGENMTKNREVQEVQQKIDVLKKQLETIPTNLDGMPETRSATSSQLYNLPNYQSTTFPYAQLLTNNQYNTIDSKQFDLQQTKNDVFTDLVLKIVDKILYALPHVLRRIFGFAFNDLTSNEYGYNLIQRFGIFGYMPLILLRLVDAFTYFMTTLRKNKFLRTFLVPAVVLGLIAGSVVFLTWFVQKDEYNYDDYNYVNPPVQQQTYNVDYNKNPPVQQLTYNVDYNKIPPKSYNVPVYTRSYYDNI